MSERKRMHKLVLSIDDGLWSHLRANFLCINLHDSVEEAAIFILREGISRDFERSHCDLRRQMIAALPKRYRKHFPVPA